MGQVGFPGEKWEKTGTPGQRSRWQSLWSVFIRLISEMKTTKDPKIIMTTTSKQTHHGRGIPEATVNFHLLANYTKLNRVVI